MCQLNRGFIEKQLIWNKKDCTRMRYFNFPIKWHWQVSSINYPQWSRLSVSSSSFHTKTFLLLKMKYLCVACPKLVCINQQALQCDCCNRWQHLICKTRFSEEDYQWFMDDFSEIWLWQCELFNFRHWFSSSNWRVPQRPFKAFSPSDEPHVRSGDEGSPMSFNLTGSFEAP